MKRLVGGVLLLLLAWPAARAQDKPKDESPTPKAQYDALMKEYQKAQQDFFSAISGAKTPEEQMKRMQEESPKLDKVLLKFVELADKHPKNPVALDALNLALSGSRVRGSSKGASHKAIDLLLRDHVTSDKLGRVVPQLASGFEKGNETLLRTILEKNPHKEVQAEASLALAQALRQKAELVKQLASNPELAKRVETLFGKEAGEELKKGDAAKLEAEVEAAFRQLADKHLSSLKPDRLLSLCQQLSFATDKGSEAILRALEKHDKREVQGNACLTLAQVLKARADVAVEKDPKQSDKLLKEAEELFSRAGEKYGDVKMRFRGTVGDKAKRELYEIRHLAIGKPAPDVEGEDQDGKKFKLSDYKGKVVLLDFWSQF
jgi:hypothetical protein